MGLGQDRDMRFVTVQDDAAYGPAIHQEPDRRAPLASSTKLLQGNCIQNLGPISVRRNVCLVIDIDVHAGAEGEPTHIR